MGMLIGGKSLGIRSAVTNARFYSRSTFSPVGPSPSRYTVPLRKRTARHDRHSFRVARWRLLCGSARGRFASASFCYAPHCAIRLTLPLSDPRPKPMFSPMRRHITRNRVERACFALTPKTSCSTRHFRVRQPPGKADEVFLSVQPSALPMKRHFSFSFLRLRTQDRVRFQFLARSGVAHRSEQSLFSSRQGPRMLPTLRNPQANDV